MMQTCSICWRNVRIIVLSGVAGLKRVIFVVVLAAAEGFVDKNSIGLDKGATKILLWAQGRDTSSTKIVL